MNTQSTDNHLKNHGFAAQRQLFFQHLAQTSPAPLALQIERAEACYLYDSDGKSYLDLISGIGPSVLGHRHPSIERAILHQLNQYWHTLVYGEFILNPQVELAALLAQQLSSLDAVYLVNSGSEATEGAMKLAKRFTGRHEIIACRNAYHGSTQGAASLMSPDYFTRAYAPLLPGIRHLNFNEDAGLEQISRKTAAVVVETVQGEAGVIPPRPDWLKALRARCTEMGALLILDEIQAAYGRTGKLFAFQHYDIQPDVLLLAKGFGGGMPIGAFVAPKAIMDCLQSNPVLGHITTFGGHPVCAAAAHATLQTLLTEDWIEQVPAKSALFREKLQHPAIVELRSAGLWFGVDLGSAEKVQKTIHHCLQRGVITDWFLFNDHSIRIAPPLTIQNNDIIFACNVLLEALSN